jgi:hypothetical protein
MFFLEGEFGKVERWLAYALFLGSATSVSCLRRTEPRRDHCQDMGGPLPTLPIRPTRATPRGSGALCRESRLFQPRYLILITFICTHLLHMHAYTYMYIYIHRNTPTCASRSVLSPLLNSAVASHCWHVKGQRNAATATWKLKRRYGIALGGLDDALKKGRRTVLTHDT